MIRGSRGSEASLNESCILKSYISRPDPIRRGNLLDAFVPFVVTSFSVNWQPATVNCF